MRVRTTEGVHGTARNPWDTTRTAAARPAAARAAVARLVPIALGNDGMARCGYRRPTAVSSPSSRPRGGPAGISDGDWFGIGKRAAGTTVATRD
ncbi:hypothetical protein [Streptomyces sp. F001]|uniref:hypothetical protein n=1 Tax=Streptomyces sp. F001 TaxID=1510026 RepID=UPI00320A1EB4